MNKQCEARCYIGDDFGDNSSTMRCQLEEGHEGPHKEVFRNGKIRLEFDEDEGEWHARG